MVGVVAGRVRVGWGWVGGWWRRCGTLRAMHHPTSLHTHLHEPSMHLHAPCRVMYLDIDVHHGDGVEEAFLTTGTSVNVGLLSLPQSLPQSTL